MRSKYASEKKRQRSVLDKSNSKEQQMLALQQVMFNKNSRSHSISASIVLDSSIATHQYFGKNIKTVIELLSETRHTSCGRTTDDKRSVVNQYFWHAYQVPPWKERNQLIDLLQMTLDSMSVPIIEEGSYRQESIIIINCR